MNNSWGPITWYVFHGLAEKIKDEEFNNNKLQLIYLIKTICYNLPCPECREHAIFVLKKLKIQNIKTKEDFQKFVWSFHNLVNKKRNVQQITFEECKNKYKLLNINKAIENFIIIWSQNTNIVKLMTESLHRNLFLEKFRKWYLENKYKFDK